MHKVKTLCVRCPDDKRTVGRQRTLLSHHLPFKTTCREPDHNPLAASLQQGLVHFLVNRAIASPGNHQSLHTSSKQCLHRTRTLQRP